MNDRKYKFIDLFAGAGGLSEGFVSEGSFVPVAHVEMNKYATDTLKTRSCYYYLYGKKRTRVFYCDPQASWQKPQIEKNHEFIRYVLPKGKTLNPYTQEDMLLLANNINSIRRESLGNKSPYEATTDKSILRLMKLMGLHTVPADEVNLTPALLKR